MWAASLCAALSAATLVVVVSAQWRAWRPLRRRRVVLVLDTGRTMQGMLVARRGPLLELADVQVVVDGGGTVAADGRVVVERARVEWLQVIG